MDISGKTLREIAGEIETKFDKNEMAALAMIWWCVWHQRNKIRFDQSAVLNKKELEMNIKVQTNSWNSARNMKSLEEKQNNQYPRNQKIAMEKSRTVRWSPPPPGFIKINFDGSVLSNGQASMSCVFRNPNGRVVHLAAQKDVSYSPLLTEARAMRFACAEAARLGLNSVILEGDCLTLINAVLCLGQGPWEIDLLALDIRNCLSRFQEVRVNHVYREANAVADKAAALRHLHPTASIAGHPDFCNLVRKDAIGWWSRRV